MFTENSSKRISKVQLKSSSNTRGQMGWGASQPANDYIFFCWSGNVDHPLGAGLIVHKGNMSAFKRVELISVGMSYITLRYRSYIIILNVHAPTEDKSDDT